MLHIVIGLPGSGKTYFCNKFVNYDIYDDCLQNLWNGKLFDSLKKKNNVIVSDPRFCDLNVFNNFLNRIEKYKLDIHLTFFKNNPEQCKKNISNSKKYIDIDNLSQVYNINNYLSLSTKIDTINVFE